MAKGIRINALSKELGIDSRAILHKLKEKGLGDKVPNHMSVIPLGLAEEVREWFQGPHLNVIKSAIPNTQQFKSPPAVQQVRSPKPAVPARPATPAVPSNPQTKALKLIADGHYDSAIIEIFSEMEDALRDANVNSNDKRSFPKPDVSNLIEELLYSHKRLKVRCNFVRLLSNTIRHKSKSADRDPVTEADARFAIDVHNQLKARLES